MRSERTRSATGVPVLHVLALLLGLLAMHGLVSGHHTGQAPALTAHVTTSVGHHDAADLAPLVHGATAVGTGAQPGQTLTGALCADCPGHGTAVLCLAVLSAGLGAVALLLARRSRTGHQLPPSRRLPLLRAGPPLHLHPPDPVRELCVSRT